MNPRHSLTFKLTGVVLLISLLSVVLVAVFTRYATVSAFDRMLAEQRRSDFATIITEYFEEKGSWDGVIDATRAQTKDPLMFIGLVIVGQDGRVVLPDRHTRIGQLIPDQQLALGTPLELDGEHIGTLLEIAPDPPPRKPEDERYLTRTNHALILAAGGVSIIALFLGILSSRTLTRSLRELTAATQAMTQGNLEQTVPVRSKDELGQLATSFNRMSVDLANANDLRRQMTADIAHDLRTPLTVIKGYTEALRDGDLPPTQATFETMFEEAQLLNHLIDDLRMLSLVDAGELTLNRRTIAPPELLSQAQAAYLPQAREADVALVIELDEVVSDVSVDPERMARVMGNLVSNALRYTAAGGQITLGARPCTTGVILSVCDTGSGIPPEDLPRIFDRFYRGDAVLQVDDGESGLGLAIVKSLVEAHNGTITVSSAVGQGTTFEITLPPS